jgi:hypothetical protein
VYLLYTSRIWLVCQWIWLLCQWRWHALSGDLSDALCAWSIGHQWLSKTIQIVKGFLVFARKIGWLGHGLSGCFELWACVVGRAQLFSPGGNKTLALNPP